MIFVMIQNIILQSKFHCYFFFLFKFIKQILIRRENWRDQRSTGNNNRRGRQNQYNSTNTRQQHNTRISRNNRYTDNRPPYEGRNSPLQTSTNEESTQYQRLNSSNYSQGQSSGPTSPSATVSARTIYSSTHRSSMNRNSPTPYTGSSSSHNNSISSTTSPPNQQSGINKPNKKSSLSKKKKLEFRFCFN